MPKLFSRRRLLSRFASLAAVGAATEQKVLAGEDTVKCGRVRIEPVEITLPSLPPGMDGFRIAQVSDLHLEPFTNTERIEHLITACNLMQPDLVAITGDFVTRTPLAAEDLAALLSELKPRHGVYATLGNHDFWSGAQEVEKALQSRRIPVLRNAMQNIHTDGGVLHLAGMDSAYIGEPDARKTLAEWKDNQPLVLMMHEPDPVDIIAAAGVQGLQLSGHTHGGQINIGGFQPTAIKRARFGRKYIEGHFHVGSMQLYVNRGIGWVGLPIRVGCPPEVTAITLRSPEVVGRGTARLG